MENTLENKAKFFAQYLNQQVFYQDRIGNIVSFYLSCGNFTNQVWIVSLEDENFEKNELSCEANINECQLILTPLSQISDEDAIKFGFTSARDFLAVADIYHSYHVDYLRSKGYALTYMDLSVEDLINYGWVKLKEN